MGGLLGGGGGGGVAKGYVGAPPKCPLPPTPMNGVSGIYLSD